METIYIESAVRDHPRARKILGRFPGANLVECDHYGELFNVRAQNFRLQKRRPSLILAKKVGRTVLPTPLSYSIGYSENHYFSHMLNCLYDCRYCFLQGMYQSANYVCFVNFEDFEKCIDEVIGSSAGAPCFFSGYDCDSLAMEGVTGFAGHFIPFFAARPGAILELRTKSVNTRPLEEAIPIPNIVVAYTLTPDPIAREVEHGAPTFEARLKRVKSLTQQGWMVGLRFDPLIPWPRFKSLYSEMIDRIFREVDSSMIHSVTLGPMRFPKAMHERVVKLYPNEPLFALHEMSLQQGQMTYPIPLEEEMREHVMLELGNYLHTSKLFGQTGTNNLTSC